MATRNWDVAIPMAEVFMLVFRFSTNDVGRNYNLPPQKSRGRRPHLSIAHKPGRVDSVFTALVIILITKAFSMPEFLKY